MSSDASSSQLIFGALNETAYQLPIYYFDIINPEQGFWQVKLNDILINGRNLDICDDGFCKAILSTGTSVIGASSQIVSKILREIDLDPSCANVDSLSTLS